MTQPSQPARNAEGDLKDALEILWYHDADSETPIPSTDSNKTVSRALKKRPFVEIEDLYSDSDRETKASCKKIHARLETESHSKSQAGNTIGNPGNSLLQKLVIKYCDPVTSKKYYACIAEKKGCDFFHMGNASKDRVFKHVKFCRFIEPELQKAVNDESASGLLGARVEAPKHVSLPTETQMLASLQPLSQLEAEAKRKGHAQLQVDMNHAILKLICVAGIAPTVLDLPEWKDLMSLASSLVWQKTLKILKTNKNLTILFDGMTTKRGDSIYTVHVTTKDCVSYLVDGFNGTGDSHTGPWITDKITKTIDSFGVSCFSAMCSDSTGNTKRGRKDAHLAMPSIMDLGDCCHHLHNTIKDITALSEFKAPILLMRALIKFFSKSSSGKAALRDERLDAGIAQGLSLIGNTWFGTFYMAASSIERCLPIIKDLFDSGKIKLKNKNLCTMLKDRIPFNKFQLFLVQYIAIVGPLARSIWSLESPHTTAADVFLFWHAITAALRDLFSRSFSETGISSALAQKVTSIINGRYTSFIDESPSDIYFASFILDPRLQHSAFLKKSSSIDTPLSGVKPAMVRTVAKSSGLPTIRIAPSTLTKAREASRLSLDHPRALERVRKFLKTLLYEEVELTKRDSLGTADSPIHKVGPAKFVDQFRQQIDNYTQRAYPFDVPCYDGDVLGWWESLQSHPQASALALITVKIFSALVNSMADERTGSRITWLNSPLRAKQGVDSLVNMVQVGQWYKHHVSSKVNSRVKRPVVGFYNASFMLAAPSVSRSSESDESESECSDSDGCNDVSAGLTDEEDANSAIGRAEFLMDEDVNLDVAALRKVVAEGSGGLTELFAVNATNEDAPGQEVSNVETADWSW